MSNTCSPPENKSAMGPTPAEKANKNKKNKSKRLKSVSGVESDKLESLPWAQSLATGKDPFALLADGTEGGFLSLEEIDESEYGLIDGSLELKPNSNKRKRVSEIADNDAEIVEEKGMKKQNKKKKKQKQKRKNKDKKKEEEMNPNEENVEGQIVVEKVEEISEDAPDNNGDAADDDDGLLLPEDDVNAWNELRLHPLLMKSVRRLGFREPTAIQKRCIPVAAHQGKDVVGAAETGSGKTLAFGLPILQRFLEEREKRARLSQPDIQADQNGTGERPLRALILTPTRELALQVCDHIKAAAKFTDISIVPIVGGMSTEKQERLLKRRPEIIVGTPGRLWEMMSGGEEHLVELHSLSFFVLDEADRMIENGHFHELQSIIDMLPNSEDAPLDSTSNAKRKKRQTFVFSATIALSDNFRKKLKRGVSTAKSSADDVGSIEKLLERAGMRADTEVVNVANASIVAHKLEESFIECSEEVKEAYLYYILTVHGSGRTMVFCTSIAALRRVSSMMQILGINARTLHAQMQQRARLKALDRFRGDDNAVLIATDVAARGLDIPGIRTVVHYQLPHSAEVYVHRSGRTARASGDGCSIALISPSDKAKFFALCRSLSKETLRSFPLEESYMPEVMKRMSLARQIDKISRKTTQENAKKRWFERHAESVELEIENSGSEEEAVNSHKQRKRNCTHLNKLLQELKDRLVQPLQPKTLSHRFLAGTGISPILQQQLEKAFRKSDERTCKKFKTGRIVVIGQDLVEPLQALRSSGHEVCVSVDKRKEMLKVTETQKKKRREEKKREREQRRKQKRKMRGIE